MTVDDEPSLGSLDGRMSQKTWGLPDYWPQGYWAIGSDNEDDGLVRGEGDDAEQEGGIEDMPHDEQVGPRAEIGVTGPSISNANDEFGVVG
jgi:hypothetical protein